MQIIVLGMHRSGTSMVARLLNMLGAYMGPEKAALEYRSGKISPTNASGHWERADVMDINDAILKHGGARWDMPIPTKSLTYHSLPEDVRHKLELLIYGLDANRPWMVKDPRLCLTLPCWKPLLEVPVCVLVYRHPAHIAASLAKRNQMPIEKGLALWEYYISQALNHSLHMPRIFVHHDALMHAPAQPVEQLYHQLVEKGVRRLDMPSEREILAFVKPELSHQSDTDAVKLSNNQQHLMQLMQGLPQLGEVPCSDASLRMLRR